MGMFDKWLWGDPDRDDEGLAIAEALDSATARLRGDLENDDCASEGPGVCYLFLPGEERPFHLRQAANVRHAVRWLRYQLSRGDLADVRQVSGIQWEVAPTTTEADAHRLAAVDRERLQPRWDGSSPRLSERWAA
jgi:hypothetical protein